jgi:hypothetical protein
MDPIEYYTTTIIKAFKTLAPFLAFLVGGYLIFVKGPFLLLRRSLREQKTKLQEEVHLDLKEDKYSVGDYLEFQRNLKLMNGQDSKERVQKAQVKGQTKKEDQKTDHSKHEHKKSDEKKAEEKKTGARRSESASSHPQTPEEVFSFQSGEKFNQTELKKRYHQLLKENHPDRVASMGPDFKKLAEKKTKEINKAFEALKKKAS